MMIIQVTLTQFTTPKLTVTVKVNLMQLMTQMVTVTDIFYLSGLMYDNKRLR